jgi:hypothetical protein
MGAFNTLNASVLCPICGKEASFQIQFKYGDTWQHVYSIGDRLKWGGNDIGVSNAAHVVVEAVGGPCPHCAADNLEFDIRVDDNRLEQVIPIGKERTVHSREGFRLTEP